jgi:BirA family transcriptional regulator, biotin operon repressor / biotin---[acetyl-CoA-carboxylase] ligase
VPDLHAAPILWFDQLDSTNAEARRRADAGAAGPLWIAARRQTAGRGRRGRAWETGEGSLAATLLMSLDRPPAEAAQLSFVAAFAIRDLARAYVPDELVGLKWPNDVLLARAKLSGVLIESGRRDGAGLWLAIGIGVNLSSAPVGLDYPAAALADHLRPGQAAPTPEAALEQLRDAFADWAGLWSREGFEPLRRAWTAAAVGLGGPCVARLGERTLEGVAEGLDADGALLLRLASGRLERITAGDVFFGN